MRSWSAWAGDEALITSVTLARFRGWNVRLRRFAATARHVGRFQPATRQVALLRHAAGKMEECLQRSQRQRNRRGRTLRLRERLQRFDNQWSGGHVAAMRPHESVDE